MSHDQKIEFIGGIWDGLIVSFSGNPPMTFLVPRQRNMLQVLEYNMFLEDLGPGEVVSVYIFVDRCCYAFSHYQYAELFKNKKD